ncbi:Na+/H+ antiporter subunit E [Donghicola sp. C2-DW-16]|uniref:Na+/H+ antiporter subunit E n=1 Tax=Donghicola mangrovi TaxID=2729614 RepID=A0A850PZE0_9RHOB|nr:Na+/H+ antiporter subunit E [Donghicola mangrovi]NVO22196.1 Na+/H+ antiporter subunit E [Donghicola mangrovi]NVO26213.1 Na+/H+ antiporter subunit E [Donghicola mangrovi]
MLKRLFPHPYLTALLTLVWMLLDNTAGPGVFILGLILGIIIPAVTAPYWPDRPVLKHPVKIAAYVMIVIYDIIKSNIDVALIVLFKSNKDRSPAWITVPLDLKTPEAITVLAGTITMTPGTLTADVSAQGHALLIHCLDAPDPDAVRDDIKARYEARLKEIFE